MTAATSEGDGVSDTPPAQPAHTALPAQPTPAQPIPPASSRQVGPASDVGNDEFIEDVTPPDGPVRGPKGTSVVTTETFKPEKWREVTRAGLAVFLAVLLGGVILVFGIAGINGYPSDEAKEYLGIVFTPLVGLVGAATGFYYGGKDNNS